MVATGAKGMVTTGMVTTSTGAKRYSDTNGGTHVGPKNVLLPISQTTCNDNQARCRLMPYLDTNDSACWMCMDRYS